MSGAPGDIPGDGPGGPPPDLPGAGFPDAGLPGADLPDGAPEEAPAAPARPFDPRMLEALVCPQTHGPLQWDAERGELVSRGAGLAYPVRDGIPVLLTSEARPL